MRCTCDAPVAVFQFFTSSFTAKSAALAAGMICSRAGARILTVGSGGVGSGLAVPCTSCTGGGGGGGRRGGGRGGRAGAAGLRRAAGGVGGGGGGGGGRLSLLAAAREGEQGERDRSGRAQGENGFGPSCRARASCPASRRPLADDQPAVRAEDSRSHAPSDKRYLFVCTNRRPGRAPKGSCAREGLRGRRRPRSRRRSPGAASRRTSCGRARRAAWTCARSGISVVQEPEHVAYGGVTLADVDAIADAVARRGGASSGSSCRASRSTRRGRCR